MRTILCTLLFALAAACPVRAQLPALTAALTRAAGPVVYADERITLTVAVASDTDAAVFAYLDMGAGLRQAPFQSDPQAQQCRNAFFEHFDCTIQVDADEPRSLTFDAFVRDAPPGTTITATLEVWPAEVGRSALVTDTLTLTLIDPVRVHLPIVGR